MKTSSLIARVPVLLSAVALAASVVARAEPAHAVLSDNGPFWAAVARGLGGDSSVLKVVAPPVPGLATQLRHLQAAAAQKPKVVLFNPYWVAETAPVIDALAAQGVKLVTLDNELPANVPHVYVGHNKPQLAASVGTYVAGLIGDGDEAAVLRMQNEKTLTPREQAAIEAIRAAHPKAVIHADVFGADTSERAYEQTKVLLTKYPKTKVLLTTNTVHSLAAMKAIRQSGAVGRVKLVAYGTALPAEATEGLNDGSLFTWVAQDPYELGRRAAVVVADLLAGKDVPATTYVDAVFVTKEKLSDPKITALAR